MVRTTSFVLAFTLSCGYVFAAPVNNTVGGSVLLQNGLDAQNLNSQFSNMSITDPCQFGAQACISGAEAQCNSEGVWEAQQCPSADTQCFVVPNTKSQGTHLKCTTPQDALQLIQNTGAPGGICGSNSTASGNCTAGSDASGNSTAATVTILVAPSTTETLGPQTTTLDPSDAASLLSSLSTSGTTSSSDATTTATPANGVGAAVVTGLGKGATATPSIILLTTGSAAPSSTPSSK